MLSLIDYQILIRLCRYSDPIIWSFSEKIFWSNDLTIRQDILIKWFDYLANEKFDFCSDRLAVGNSWGGVGWGGSPPEYSVCLNVCTLRTAHCLLPFSTIFKRSSTLFYIFSKMIYNSLIPPHWSFWICMCNNHEKSLYLLNQDLTVLLLFKEYHYTEELQSWAFYCEGCYGVECAVIRGR